MIFGSVCSGMEAASLAWTPLGWKCAFVSEIDKAPCALLKERYPDVPNFGDMTKFEDWPDVAIDLLVGGTPCQSFSVAGLRKGLTDPRGSLMLTYGAIAKRYRPTWLLWENVPGVLSSNEGRDFGAFLGMLAELGYGFAYRVLDAQFVGLAQRRKRVFVVGYLGDWRPPAAVLIEPESMSGNPAPRRKTGEGIAATITASLGGSSGKDDIDGRVVAYGGNNTSGPIDVATAVNAHPSAAGRQDFESETFIVDQTPWSITPSNSNKEFTGRVAEKAQTVTTQTGQPPAARGGDIVVMGFTTKDHGQDAGAEVAPTLRAMNDDSSHANGGGQVGVAYSIQAGGGDVIAFDTYNQEITGDVTQTLCSRGDTPGGNSHLVPAVTTEWAVRRLTPRECERLQGAPDDYTLVTYRGKPMADGPRYKMIGNSFAVNCVRWIGERIDLVRSEMERAA